MVKMIAFLIPLLIGFNDSELKDIRKHYFNATTAKGVEQFKEATLKCKEKSALCEAYKGAALTMSAGFSPGLFNRIELFNNGKDLIEKAVHTDPNNAEIRFIRYSIQANVPAILFYSSEMEDDIEVIEKFIHESDHVDEFWNEALRVMSVSERVSEDHIERIDNLKDLLK